MCTRAHNRGMSISIHSVLGTALEAARAALRDLDADQIPNDLRRVVAHSGALVPPIAKALVKGLDKYEWLREKASGLLPEDAKGPRGQAAAAFLQRPDGWELRLAEIAADLAAGDAEAAQEASEAKLRQVKAHLKAAKAKARAQGKEAQRKIAEQERRLGEMASERRSEAAGDARTERDTTRVVKELESELARLQATVDAAEEKSRRLSEARIEERALRRTAEAGLAAAAETEGWADDPTELADRLDRLGLMARLPARARESRYEETGAEEIALPPGVAPDAKPAIDWLIDLPIAATVIVDGYNLGYFMAGDQLPGPARIRVAPVVERLQRVAKGRFKIIVVYDSNLGPAETPPSPGPITVRYSEAGETADDEIVRLVAATPGVRVVVSNDRGVRDRSERAGAIVLWSQALAAWTTLR